MKIKCPNCNKNIEAEESELEYHKVGRQFRCPKCKKMMLLKKQARGLKYDESGKLVRKYKRV